ncbi:MAG: copper chaperone [Ferruginibacter sp.]
MEILVFKTNLTDVDHISNVMPVLNLHPHIKEWNVDLHDTDNILRIVSKSIAPKEVENILQNAGYYCKELL